MKVIDLFNKIANGEELPKKIKIGCEILTLDDDKKNYSYRDCDEYYGDALIHWFGLNDEVEIIEKEKKIPEKLKMLRHSCNFDRHEEALYENQVDLANKITEILDYLKSKGDE